MRTSSGSGDGGPLTVRDLSVAMSKLKIAGDGLSEDERAALLGESFPDLDHQVDFELFLRVREKHSSSLAEPLATWRFLVFLFVCLFWRCIWRCKGGLERRTRRRPSSRPPPLLCSTPSASPRSPPTSPTSIATLARTPSSRSTSLSIRWPTTCSRSPRTVFSSGDPRTSPCYLILGWLGRNVDVWFCMWSKLINIAAPGTIDERAINTKRVLNPWEKNENHTLCLHSAKAIGCTLVNIGTQDLAEGRVSLYYWNCRAPRNVLQSFLVLLNMSNVFKSITLCPFSCI